MSSDVLDVSSINLLNKIHERSLRTISDDKKSDFQTLLENHNLLIVHQRNLQSLMKEVYKILNGYVPPIMENLFVFLENVHNIRNLQVIYNKNINPVRHGLETICHRTPFLGANLPTDIKLTTSLSDFKSEIKSWKCNFCVCCLCQGFF